MNTETTGPQIKFELTIAEREALIAFLAGRGITRYQRFSSLPNAGRDKKIRFAHEALEMQGCLTVYLQASKRSGIDFLEYVWRFTCSKTQGEYLVAVWPFTRGLIVDREFLCNGVIQSARLRAVSTNPKLLLEDLAQVPPVIDRGIERWWHRQPGLSLWNFQLSWEETAYALWVRVPFVQLFQAEGVERIDLISPRVTIAIEGPSPEAGRGEMRYTLRPPWQHTNITHDLLTLDACVYVPSQRHWCYRPARIRDEEGTLPPGWYQQMRSLIRANLRTVHQLRAEFIRECVARTNEDPFFVHHPHTQRGLALGNIDQQRADLEELTNISPETLHPHLDRLGSDLELWKEYREMLRQMLDAPVEGRDLTREPALYGAFNPHQETDATTAELHEAHQALLGVIADIDTVVTKITTLLEQYSTYRANIVQARRDRRRAQLGSPRP